MSDEQPVEHDGEKAAETEDVDVDVRGEDDEHDDDHEDSDENRQRREDRRSLIDLTRAERGEPERRRLPGVDRRANADDER